MSIERELEGYWWLPTAPDTQWFGRLQCEPTKSPRLTLQYRTVDETSSPPLANVESFFGIDKYGTPISFLRVGCGGGEQAGFLANRRYSGGHVLNGIHVTSRDAFRVHRFDVSLHFLSDWLREEGFQETHDGNFNVRYSRPADRCFDVANGVTIRLFHAWTSEARARHRKIRYDIFFAVEKERSFQWKQASRHVDALRTLLHFATLRPVRTTALTFENLDHTFELSGKRYPKAIDVFNASITQPLTESVHEDDFVFVFQDIEDRFGVLCAKWFEFCVHQKEALGCYHTTVYFNLPDPLTLVAMSQALEAYHQRLFRPKRDIKFRDRVRQLCEIRRDQVEGVVGDVEKFATLVTNSRDYYIHHHPSIRAKGSVATGNTLTFLTYHLQFLFRLCVLAQFDLDRDRFNLLRRQIPNNVVEY